MLERLARPDLPIRDVLLQTHSVIRRSCGAHLDAEIRPRPMRHSEHAARAQIAR
jgi:hypothetical protein